MATITLTPGVLPQPACYGSEQDRFDAYVASIIAAISGGIQWVAQDSAPADLTLYWLRLDAAGRPMEALKWSIPDGAWVRFKAEVINTATAGGAANAYTLTNSPAMTAATAYAVGQAFTFKATFANTGTATLNVDGLGAKTIKKLGGASDLIQNDIITNQMVKVVYDGTNFQIVNPSSVLVVYSSGVSYAQDNSSGSPPSAITLSVTKPASAEWDEFDLCASSNARTDNGLNLECQMTFESGTISGSNVSTKPGCGNDAQAWTGTVDNDSTVALWRRIGQMPQELSALNTVSFKVTLNVTNGNYDGNGTLYAYIRATYKTKQ